MLDEQQQQYEAAVAAERHGSRGGRDRPGRAVRGGGARSRRPRPKSSGESRRRCGRGRPGQGRGPARIHQDHFALRRRHHPPQLSRWRLHSFRRRGRQHPRPLGRAERPDARGHPGTRPRRALRRPRRPGHDPVDALAGQVFQGKVSRFANSETEQKLDAHRGRPAQPRQPAPRRHVRHGDASCSSLPRRT